MLNNRNYRVRLKNIEHFSFKELIIQTYIFIDLFLSPLTSNGDIGNYFKLMDLTSWARPSGNFLVRGLLKKISTYVPT
jgi:hypothetical protein